MNTIKLEVLSLDKNGRLPTRNLETDAGWDLSASEDKVIFPGKIEFVPTGIAVVCPKGYYYEITGRSGLNLKKITSIHGIIDATYCGQLFVGLRNESDNCYEIKIGDRIGQIIVHQVIPTYVQGVGEVSEEYRGRGEAGWGSSGK